MSYNIVTRYMNITDLLPAAKIRIEEKKLIDTSKYKILMYGIQEPDEENDKAMCRVLVTNLETNEDETLYFYMAKDLNLCPKTVANYYIYRFLHANIKLGDAIRVVKEPIDENDIDTYAYNAIIVYANSKQLSYVMVPSKGPMHRYLTARQAYENNIKVYKYLSPDDYENFDNYEEEHSELIL